MANNNNTGTNRVEVPEAREALNRFKMEVANELGIPLKQGYNGDLTSRQNGSIGGEMVRRMIRQQEQAMAGQSGQQQ
ncbi:MAG TPA: alpha/beta-type small acid-soluble spore protein [Mobilitalea sp.]|nr:alpha/beta-type small acid-soluble spore protein [Mobilitalea sp.]